MAALYEHDPSLIRPFPSSVYASGTYNFGPQTVCCAHCDQANLPNGMCSITPFGKYNPKTGGHLVLWDLKLVIEFPPGSTILIPSAVLTHSNTAILPDETRYSFTQYSAGGLFRWVENSFMTDDDRRALRTKEEQRLRDEKNATRWIDGIEMLPVLDCSPVL